MRGRFVVIEGGDGSGKSSVIEFLKGKFADKSILFTREPGGTPAAEEIRKVIVAKRDTPLDTATQLFLCGAFRRDHVVQCIEPTLAAGQHVISSRFSASTYAYQVTAGGADKEFFAIMDPLSRDGLEPDMTILLDLDPAVGLVRKKSYKADLDVFEERELAFHEAVRRGTKEYLATRPHTVIDASRPQAEVQQAVYDVLNTLIS